MKRIKITVMMEGATAEFLTQEMMESYYKEVKYTVAHFIT